MKRHYRNSLNELMNEWHRTQTGGHQSERFDGPSPGSSERDKRLDELVLPRLSVSVEPVEDVEVAHAVADHNDLLLPVLEIRLLRQIREAVEVVVHFVCKPNISSFHSTKINTLRQT